jgi:hypothetical protein
MDTASNTPGEAALVPQTTALAPVSRAELVQAEKNAAKQIERANKNQQKSFGVVVLGGVGVGTVILGHFFVPLAVGCLLVQACGFGAKIAYGIKSDKYKRRQAAAKVAQVEEHVPAIVAAGEARREAWRLAAESILTHNTGAYTVGQEVRIEVQGAPPVILRVETVGTGLDDEDRPVRKIYAQIYEAYASENGGLMRYKRSAIFPMIVSMPLEQSSDPGSAVGSADPVPPSPPRSAVDKRLPPCTP